MFVGAADEEVLDAVPLEELLAAMVVEANMVPWRRDTLVDVEELRVELLPDMMEPLASAKVVASTTVEPFCGLVVE